jgi:hypothetical protein
MRKNADRVWKKQKSDAILFLLVARDRLPPSNQWGHGPQSGQVRKVFSYNIFPKTETFSLVKFPFLFWEQKLFSFLQFCFEKTRIFKLLLFLGVQNENSKMAWKKSGWDIKPLPLLGDILVLIFFSDIQEKQMFKNFSFFSFRKQETATFSSEQNKRSH